MPTTALVVDDEKNIRRTLEMVLGSEGINTREAATAEEALAILEHDAIDLVILDIRLPQMSGLEALAQIRQQATSTELPVLVISGHAGLEEAVQAVQLGANDFFEKPLDRERVLVSVRNAVKTLELEREVQRLKRRARDRDEMIGDSEPMRALFRQIEKVAPTNGRVLITGESGTGKELIARALHRMSQRSSGPFIKVNCAAIPAELIESELFGHAKGAFTGAQRSRQGLFEAAHTGTLFLDEIGDMSLSAQAKVLRALQSGEITRVGSEQTVTVDVRVIAATHRDLAAEVTSAKFREDLYFRLNVVPLRSPALRERAADIPLLVAAFLREFSEENGLKAKPVDAEVVEALQQAYWPGNVRELRNVVERMAILSGDRITLNDLPELGAVERRPPGTEPGHPSLQQDSAIALPNPHEHLSLREFRQKAETHYIRATLEHYAWNISKAASALGLERTNLHKKMRAYDIKRDR